MRRIDGAAVKKLSEDECAVPFPDAPAVPLAVVAVSVGVTSGPTIASLDKPAAPATANVRNVCTKQDRGNSRDHEGRPSKLYSKHAHTRAIVWISTHRRGQGATGCQVALPATRSNVCNRQLHDARFFGLLT